MNINNIMERLCIILVWQVIYIVPNIEGTYNFITLIIERIYVVRRQFFNHI